VPDVGWIDIDPTNDQFATDRYVTTAWGRDYEDVPPLKGVIFSESRDTELSVHVDVVAL
jgi:transglutaminase-like putative cysteine protease